MAIKKFGENLSFSEENILQPKEALADIEIAKRFVKMAKTLKRIAPKAEDFLYGHAVMMHAAEASLVNQETGEPVKNKKGEPAKGYFENIKVKGGKESVKWISPDDVKPYKNANGDIFPEAELLKAYKKWVGKPLCKDHKSDSVDGIRGIVIDTYYDPKFKRVHALFALDRKNYADLARKVETGYANCVSMGTAVGRSVCTECSNVAAVEKEYCNCIRGRTHYGEINLDLNPIELSLVVNGADGLAKIRNVIASMNNYVQQKTARIEQLKADRCVNPTELQQLSDSVSEMQKRLGSLMGMEKKALDKGEESKWIEVLQKQLSIETDENKRKKIQDMLDESLGLNEEPAAPVAAPDMAPVAAANDGRTTLGDGEEYSTQSIESDSGGKVGWPPFEVEVPQRFANQKVGGENLTQDALSQELSLLRNKVENMNNAFNELKTLISKEENNMNSARLRARAKARRAYWLGGGGVNEPTPGKPKYEKEDAESIREKEDKQMVGEPLETGSEGLHPGDKEVKEKLLRAEEKQEGKLSTAELEERKMKRRAYWLGGGGLNEPAPGKVKYPKEEADKIRNTEDKHMQPPDNMGGTDGAFPGDMEVKKKLLRAKLRAKLVKVADNSGNLVKDASRWDIYAGDQLILSAAGSEVYEDELDDNWDYFSSKQYGSDVLKMIRTEGFDQVAYLLKGAQDPLAPAAPGAAPMPAPAAELPPPAPAAAPAEAPKAEEKGGVNLEKVNAALSTMEEKIAELRDLLGKEGEGLVDVDVNVGEKGPMDKVLSFREDALKIEALLNDAADELALVSETLEGLDKVEASNKERLLKAAADVLADSDVVLTEANLVIEAAKKKDKKEDKKDEKADKKDKKEEKAEKKEKEDKEDKKDKKEDKEDKKAEAQKLLDDALKVRAANRAALLKAAMGMYGDDAADMVLDPKTEEDLKKLLVEEKGEVSPEGQKMHPDLAEDMAKDKKKDDDDEEEEEVEVEEGEEDEKEEKEDDAADMAEPMCACGPEGHAQDCMMAADPMAASPAAGGAAGAPVMASRKSAREALVARAEGVLGKYQLDLGKAQNATEPTYFQAHPGGKGTVTELTSTKTQEAKVETISEVHEVMRDVAESGPRQVREAAAVLQEKIVEGAVKAEDVERLVREGKVDGAAAAYWKKYFAQAPDAGSFGADLSKEFAKGKKEASDNNYKLKLRRAYDIAIQAQEKGLISGTRESLDTYVDEIMHFDDAAFESNKRVVANYKSTAKKGGTLPRVGLEAASAVMTATASAGSAPESSLVDQLGALGWK